MKKIRVTLVAVIEVEDEQQRDLAASSEAAFIDLELQLQDKLQARELKIEDIQDACI
jgi:hypothetical protein